MCRMDVPKDTIIIATGHNDTTMIDEVYEHLNDKDKSNKIKKAISNKIGDSLFNADKQETNKEIIIKQDRIDYSISNAVYEIDMELLNTFDKSILSKEEIEFVNKTSERFSVGLPSLKVKKILIKLLSLGLIAKIGDQQFT
ncbi:hypothetical protein HMPREF1536_03000 [Parabacteroides gordonii MS-1 = DSM 23371]|uniref:Uncharacterized protein n=3 Tax=Parabacteroides gordonii TaxID=574930 RepID=A0A0F5JCQ4_9BACT|nr:hypothetical protein HMPREF1536_03000 [Parabacteroides gordonii MS-1 = DSM 23371]